MLRTWRLVVVEIGIGPGGGRGIGRAASDEGAIGVLGL